MARLGPSGTSIRREARVAMFLGTGRKMRPVQCHDFLGRESKDEVFREPVKVALDLLVEALGSDAIECGELGIDQHSLSA
jgi:hypothetical protein